MQEIKRYADKAADKAAEYAERLKGDYAFSTEVDKTRYSDGHTSVWLRFSISTGIGVGYKFIYHDRQAVYSFNDKKKNKATIDLMLTNLYAAVDRLSGKEERGAA